MRMPVDFFLLNLDLADEGDNSICLKNLIALCKIGAIMRSSVEWSLVDVIQNIIIILWNSLLFVQNE